MWLTSVVLGVIGVVIVFLGERGWYIADNRFIMFWNPSRSMAQQLASWDSQPNLGGPTGPQGFFISTYMALVRSIGIQAWGAERILHGTLIAVGAIGVAFVIREFIPRSRLAPLVGGLWWIAAPYTVAYLTPSGLYLHAALCPWLFYAFLRGVTSPSRWRWAAVAAAIIALTGFLNAPALVHASIPLIPLVIYLLATRQTTVGVVIGWILRQAILVPLLLFPWLARVVLATSLMGENLGLSETAEVVSSSSSWAESLRGLGGWSLYWNPKGQLMLPQLGIYLDSVAVVLITLVPVVVGVAVIGLSRFRARLLFGSIMLICAAVMVGAYPLSESSPFGAGLLALYKQVPATFALRNVFKAGPGLLLATCMLFAYAIDFLYRRLSDRRVAQRVLLSGFAVMFIVSSSPLWTGAEYVRTQRNQGIPSYWTEAFDWLDAQPGGSRVMITPSTLVEQYQWGSATGGDLFASLLKRPYVLETLLKTPSADASNLIFSLASSISEGSYRPGSIGPIAHRLGIGYVLIRNDIKWRVAGSARPATLASLRSDPDLQLVAEFGQPGQNVVEEGDSSLEALEEASLPPVQIYAVAGNSEPIRVVNGAPAILLSGDGEAWQSLAIEGVLDTLGPVRYTGRMSNAELLDELDRGAAVYITDTNRLRRGRSSLGARATLSDSERKRTENLFLEPGTQSVAAFTDATSITSISEGELVAVGAVHRPGAAFDGDQRTSWQTGAGLPLGTNGLRIDLRAPREIDSVVVRASQDSGNRSVQSIRVDFPDGTSLPAAMRNGVASLSFKPVTVDSLEIVVTSVGGGAGPFGFSEVEIEGLDLGEVIQLPDDLRMAADEDPAIASAMVTAPLTYQFDREQTSEEEIEGSLRRRFSVIAARSFALNGSTRFGDLFSDTLLARVLGVQIRAVAQDQAARPLDRAAPLMGDGDPRTGWQPVAENLPTASVGFDRRTIRSVDVTLDQSNGASAPQAVVISIGGVTYRSEVTELASCPAVGLCAQTIRVPVRAVATDSMTLSLEPQPKLPNSFGTPTFRVVELSVNGVSNAALPERLDPACRDDLATVDRSSLPLSLDGTVSALINGGTVGLSSCGTTALGAGWHELHSTAGVLIDHARMRAIDGVDPVPAESLPVSVLVRKNTFLNFAFSNQGRTQIISGLGFLPGWRGKVDEGAAMLPVELDTQSGWIVTADGDSVVRATFAPQTLYVLVVLIWLLGMLAASAIAGFDPRARGVPTRPRFARPPNPRFIVGLVVVAFNFAIAGFPGALLAIIALELVRRRIMRARAIGVIAVVFLVLMAISMVPPLGPELTPLSPAWVKSRGAAHLLAQFGAVFAAISIALGSARFNDVDEDDSGSLFPALDELGITDENRGEAPDEEQLGRP
jgi:arabinofuranan 3-O-arabinosyltransferase